MKLRLLLFAIILKVYYCEKVVLKNNLGLDEHVDLEAGSVPPLVRKEVSVDYELFEEDILGSSQLGIIGGLTTNITEHPYQVAIDNGKKFVCSGALINRIWVIALASCVVGMSTSNLQARVGSNSNLYGGTLFNVTEIVTHPNFNYTSMDYDFALLKLQTYICFDAETQYVDFSLKSPQNKYIGTISGWGTQKTSKGKFRQLKMGIILNRECRKKYLVTNNNITNRMFCAVKGKKGPCYGDFGDPIVVNGTLYGLYSWSRGCARPDYPAVFSNLASVADWIHSTMNDKLYCSCNNY